MTAAAAAVIVAVDPQGPNADKVSPGLLGFLTVFFLALAVVLLVRSMTKHLRKVRYSPGPDGEMWTPPGTVGAPRPGTEPAASGRSGAAPTAADEGPQGS